MSIFGLFKDVAEIALAPVEIAANVTRVVTKPVADLAKDLVKETRDLGK